MTFADFFGDQAAEKIQFVRTCYSDQDIGCLNAGIQQGIDTGCIAQYPHNVCIFRDVLDLFGDYIHHNYIVPFIAELFGKGTAHFTAA